MKPSGIITAILTGLFLVCASHLSASSMEWVQASDPLTPRAYTSICYNPETESVLLFGGDTGNSC